MKYNFAFLFTAIISLAIAPSAYAQCGALCGGAPPPPASSASKFVTCLVDLSVINGTAEVESWGRQPLPRVISAWTKGRPISSVNAKLVADEIEGKEFVGWRVFSPDVDAQVSDRRSPSSELVFSGECNEDIVPVIVKAIYKNVDEEDLEHEHFAEY